MPEEMKKDEQEQEASQSEEQPGKKKGLRGIEAILDVIAKIASKGANPDYISTKLLHKNMEDMKLLEGGGKATEIGEYLIDKYLPEAIRALHHPLDTEDLMRVFSTTVKSLAISTIIKNLELDNPPMAALILPRMLEELAGELPGIFLVTASKYASEKAEKTKEKNEDETPPEAERVEVTASKDEEMEADEPATIGGSEMG